MEVGLMPGDKEASVLYRLHFLIIIQLNFKPTVEKDVSRKL